MTPKKMLEEATVLAAEAHAGQLDKVNHAYIGHPARVAYAVMKAGGDLEFQTVAWLHDVVEDTWVTPNYLLRKGYSLTVVEAVDALSDRKGETMEEYYYRVRVNPVARFVKRFDIDDNSDPDRIKLLSPAGQEKTIAKYIKARSLLGIGESTWS